MSFTSKPFPAIESELVPSRLEAWIFNLSALAVLLGIVGYAIWAIRH